MNIPGFITDRHIASGGFGDVYLAHKPEGNRKYAIKLIRSELLNNDELVRRFQREVELCRNLKHPNIVPILESGTTASNVPYFVMPYISGTTIRTELRRVGRMPLERALLIFARVCDALSFAHNSGIIHRDIKASNILLDDNDTIFVADFGLAKLLADDGPNLTQSLEVIGTPACMAPEQAHGQPVDERTDIYSLGVLLYELLAGSLPFANSSMTVLAQLHSYAERPRLEGRADLPGELSDVIARAMEVIPDKRFQSVSELVTALTRAATIKSFEDYENYLFLHIEDSFEELSDSEDLLDDLHEKLEQLGASIVIRANHRLAMVVPTSMISPSELEMMWSTSLAGPRLSIGSRPVSLASESGEPSSARLLNEPWPSFQAGLHQIGSLEDASTIFMKENK